MTDMSAALRCARLIRYAKSKNTKAHVVHQWAIAVKRALAKG